MGTFNTSDLGHLAKYGLQVRQFTHWDDEVAQNFKTMSTMAYVPKYVSSGLPQAELNGLELGGFWVDVFHCSQPTASSDETVNNGYGSTARNTPANIAAVSQPGVVPWTDISWLNARIAASNRVIQGRACHLMTPFERASLLYLVLMSGHDIRGNNNNGKDTRDTDTWDNYGIFDPVQPSYRTLTGSGPSSWWSHGIPAAGVFGLVGNIYDWEDLRLESGIFQPKAYLAGGQTAADTYIDYDDNSGGDAADICQLTPGVYTIADDGVHGVEDVTVERVLITGRFTGRLILSAGLAAIHNDNTLIRLKTAVDLCNGAVAEYKAIGAMLVDATSKYMALPDIADTTTDIATYLDSWYPYDNADSRALLRGGYWSHTSNARRGFVVTTVNTPTSTGNGRGFRAALSIGTI